MPTFRWRSRDENRRGRLHRKPFSDDTISPASGGGGQDQAKTDPLLAARISRPTPREREVELLVIGHPNKVVAHQLEHQPARGRDPPRACRKTENAGQSLRNLVRIAMQAGHPAGLVLDRRALAARFEAQSRPRWKRIKGFLLDRTFEIGAGRARRPPPGSRPVAARRRKMTGRSTPLCRSAFTRSRFRP